MQYLLIAYSAENTSRIDAILAGYWACQGLIRGEMISFGVVAIPLSAWRML